MWIFNQYRNIRTFSAGGDEKKLLELYSVRLAGNDKSRNKTISANFKNTLIYMELLQLTEKKGYKFIHTNWFIKSK